MGKGAAVNEETPYEAAEKRLGVPPVRERGRDMENPPELSCWQWVSLGHLELMVEVEQQTFSRTAARRSLSRLQSYKDFEKAVRANLPAS